MSVSGVRIPQSEGSHPGNVFKPIQFTGSIQTPQVATPQSKRDVIPMMGKALISLFSLHYSDQNRQPKRPNKRI